LFPNWLDQLLTRSPHHLHDLGYLRELMNIRTCYRWWQAAWEPHLEHSRALVRSAMNRCPRRRKAVILGSGLLYDVPIAELSAAFEKVILVDLLHPFSTRLWLRKFKNVSTLNADISGVVEGVHEVAASAKQLLPRATPDLFLGDEEVDFVASVNLLSQLPCLPANYLRRVGVHTREAIESFGRDVVRAHIDYLRRLPGVVALIADVEATTLNRQGAILNRTSTVYGVELPWKGEEWTWRLIPFGRRPPHHSEWLTVLGVEDIKAAENVGTA
jgi:hypothetical protein